MSEEKNEILGKNQDDTKKVVEEVKSETTQDNAKEVNIKEPQLVKELEDTSEQDLEEQLSVVKEVRDELANAYTTAKEQKTTIEQLGKEVETLKSEKGNVNKTIESLSKELDVFKTREVEAEKIAYNKRLEQLSNDFKTLGQEKTIEHLSTMPKAVIAEFEAITGAALTHKNEEQLDSVTVPSESMGTKAPEVKNELKPKNFSFAGLCNTLQKQQTEEGSSLKRTINM